MNPEIDLQTFRRGDADRGESAQTRPLVGPPRRILTRYVLPLALLGGFAAVSVFAARDALIPAIEVQVVQPVLAPVNSAGEQGGEEASSAVQEAGGQAAHAGEKASSEGGNGGSPLFQAPGWVEPDPFTTLVSALIPGTVARVHVREGETVGAGQVVAELDDADARVALRKAEANLSVRQAELQAAEASWQNPISLEETIKTARAEKARLEAERVKLQRQSEFSRKQAEASRRLGQSGAEGTLVAEKADVEARVAEATLKEIDAKILSQAATLEAATRRAELRLEDRAALALAKAQVEEATAAVEEARLRLSRCRVTAPTTGTVMRLHATPGSMISMDVQHGTQIVSMYEPKQVQVRAEVPLAEAGKVQIGLPAEIRVEAMPDRVFHGELTRIVHEADVQRNSLPVKVRVLDPDPRLKPEMVARLQFKSVGEPEPKAETSRNDDPAQKPETAEPESQEAPAAGDGLFIPGSLLPADAKNETLLWVVGPDMRAHRKAITLGRGRRGELRQVAAGLQLSDKLIASNIEKLKEGGRVRIAAADHERKP